MMCRPRAIAAFVACLIASTAEALTLWQFPDALPDSIPKACREVLSRNITCSGPLVTAAQVLGGQALTDRRASRYCTSECGASLRRFRLDAEKHCGSITYRMFPDSDLEQSAVILASGLLWAYDLSCLESSSGFCLKRLYDGKENRCSECALRYGAVMSASDWGREFVSPESFSSLLSSCGADPTRYTYDYSPSMPRPGTKACKFKGKSNSQICSGTNYTVKAGDSCVSISRAAGVATDRMIYLNHLDYNCETIEPGRTLCLEGKCALHIVKQNETCADITQRADISTMQLISWNPAIHADCANLDAMVGRGLCVSPPDDASFDGPTRASEARHPTLASSMFSDWISATPLDTYEPLTTRSSSSTPAPRVTPAMRVNVYNATRAALVAQRSRYCWIRDQDWAEGADYAGLPGECQSLIDTYCFPDPAAAVPTSPLHIPAVCTPAVRAETQSPTQAYHSLYTDGGRIVRHAVPHR